MTLPTLDKAWNFDVNNAINAGSAVNNGKQATLDLKTALVAAGWTVRGSCDGAGGYGNDDDTDRWADVGDIVTGAAGANHSWCVLQNDSWAARNYHLFVLLENRSSNAAYPGGFRISIAQDHYTGGTATAAPTATTEVQIHAPGTSEASQFYCDNATQIVWHAIWDDDGECFRWILCQSSYAVAWFMVETVKNPLMALNDAYVSGARGWGLATAGADKLTLNFCNTVAGLSSWVSGHGAVTYFMTTEYCGSTSITVGVNGVNPDDGSAFMMVPIGLVTLTDTSYAYGRNGELYDLWWGTCPGGPTAVPVTGDTYGAGGADDFLFAHFSHLVFPWDGDGAGAGTTPQIA